MFTKSRVVIPLRETLHHYMVNHSDHKHADPSYEVTYATACIDIADEFCADFPASVSIAALDTNTKPTVSGHGEKATESPSHSAQLAMEL